MILAPICRNEAYGSFYYEVGGHKILDNGSAEGEEIIVDELIGWARTLKVDEVIAPDVLYDMEATCTNLIKFCDRVEGRIKVMAVLQATTWQEFDIILNTALELHVAAVALPKLLTKHLGLAVRIAAAEKIRQKSEIPIHCLGAAGFLQEARELGKQGIVRSIDSAAPTVLGLQSKHIAFASYDWETSHKAIPEFWSQQPTNQVEVNIAAFSRWCEGPSAPPLS